MGRLDGKVALISGGAGGMARGMTEAFLAEGASVMLGDIEPVDIAAFDGEGTGRVAAVHLDVTDEASWTAAVSATTARFGGLDVLVNNAGILRVMPLVMTTADEFMRTAEVNQLGVFLGMKAAAPVMVAAGGGSIVNISSVAGLTGSVGHVAYAASKWAVRGMTKVAALELAPSNVRVNSIHPGLVETPMLASYRSLGFEPQSIAGRVPVGRLAEVADVVPLAVYLASDESRYSTGSEFVVDGGFTAGVASGST